MIPLAKNIKRYFSFKEIIIVLLAIVISVSAGIGVFLNFRKELVVVDGGKSIVIKTMKNTVKEALNQKGIHVKAYDYVSMPLDQKLQKVKKNKLVIKRAVPINVEFDGQKKKIMTYKDIVKDALTDKPVNLGSNDKLVGAGSDDRIVKGMDIKVVRIKQEIVSEKSTIPFKTVSRENDRMDAGQQKVIQNGREGIRVKDYKVLYEDGKATVKKLIKDSIRSVPVNKIVELGTIMSFRTSRGDAVRYRKVLVMRATAYTASYASTKKHPGDPGFGITYTGMRVRKGVVAVDPRVIPLHSKLYIEGIGRVKDYGYAVAADIGSAVKGNKIDLYMPDTNTCLNWGVRKVNVYILTDD
ncbi:MAG TPA: 3D domain-containing protein [Clostridia bacterium]|nr:3D domain-containing protein [Clostridia bacterium]